MNLTTLSNKAFENIVEKGKKMFADSIFYFPRMFFNLTKTTFNFSVIFVLSSAMQNFVIGKAFTLSQTSPGFYMSAVQVY